ncbi:MAG: AAA family ATPase [Candidatus Marinimicrobia bacterium]|nr:AAA family ATPase [Candidatus Neomarinimicrobiota bacterium]MCH7858371.1 AAA family ATPase [Candidatus Neomarinimicrobiota bacterium]
MNNAELNNLTQRIAQESEYIDTLMLAIGTVIVGQHDLIQKMLIAMLSRGHVLLEGVPGLAKTLMVSTLSSLIQTKFQRLQFTPDLLPADLIGTLIYNPKDGSFETHLGPIFTNIVLADEINRAPAKVQSALLESMQEGQVTIGTKTYPLPQPFMVMATQNPIEHEGTYPLPEAQIDRFMFKLLVDYPSTEEELLILQRMAVTRDLPKLKSVVKAQQILKSREVVNDIYLAENIQKYIVSLVAATRNTEEAGLGELKDLIAFGASPRASIYIAIAARARAFLNHRGYVILDDIRDVARPVLRHRILLSYEAEAENVTTEEIIDRLFETIPTP